MYLPKIYNGKNRTFFFFSYEGVRKDAPFSMNTSVPTAAMRNGDYSELVDSQGRLSTIYDPWTTNTTTWARQPFSYGGKINSIDPSRLSPLAKYMYSVIPLPTNNLNPLLTSNWYGQAPDNTHQFTTASRIDHRFTSKDQVYARVSAGASPHLGCVRHYCPDPGQGGQLGIGLRHKLECGPELGAYLFTHDYQ